MEGELKKKRSGEMKEDWRGLSESESKTMRERRKENSNEIISFQLVQ